jgi:hypothetical protein
MKILYKLATYGRPHMLKRTLDNIEGLSASDNFFILVTSDGDDKSMDLFEGYETDSHVSIVRYPGRVTKVQNMNRGIELVPEWDILVGMSDDMLFTVQGFDDVIRKSFDNLDQCLHFPDGNRRDLLTLPVMGRTYYERFGYIYHPDYISLWCDNEMMQVARMLNAYKFVDVDIVNHLHPEWGKGKDDETYKEARDKGYYWADEATFNKRIAEKFGLQV